MFDTDLFIISGTLGVISTISIVLGVSSLVAIYLLPHIMQLTPVILELLLYATSCGLMWSDHYFNVSPYTQLFFTFLGCVTLAPAVVFTLIQHVSKSSDFAVGIQTTSAVCSLIWGYQAIRLQSQLLGTFSIAALFTCLGFMIVILPFCYIVGFKNDAVMLRTMNVTAYLIHAYAYAMFQGLENHSYFLPFRPGLLLLGGIVYFIGCLIISNKYYSWREEKDTFRYIRCNFIAIGSGFAALALGSTLPALKYLQGLGGTFFLLLVVEKWIEIPWGEKYWAWGVTGFGVVMYGLVQWIHQHPEFVLGVPN